MDIFPRIITVSSCVTGKVVVFAVCAASKLCISFCQEHAPTFIVSVYPAEAITLDREVSQRHAYGSKPACMHDLQRSAMARYFMGGDAFLEEAGSSLVTC